MTTKDKAKFDENQLAFYEKHGFVQGLAEALKNMPTGKESARLEALRNQTLEEMKALNDENESLLGINGTDE